MAECGPGITIPKKLKKKRKQSLALEEPASAQVPPRKRKTVRKKASLQNGNQDTIAATAKKTIKNRKSLLLGTSEPEAPLSQEPAENPLTEERAGKKRKHASDKEAIPTGNSTRLVTPAKRAAPHEMKQDERAMDAAPAQPDLLPETITALAARKAAMVQDSLELSDNVEKPASRNEAASSLPGNANAVENVLKKRSTDAKPEAPTPSTSPSSPSSSSSGASSTPSSSSSGASSTPSSSSSEASSSGKGTGTPSSGSGQESAKKSSGLHQNEVHDAQDKRSEVCLTRFRPG